MLLAAAAAVAALLAQVDDCRKRAAAAGMQSRLLQLHTRHCYSFSFDEMHNPYSYQPEEHYQYNPSSSTFESSYSIRDLLIECTRAIIAQDWYRAAHILSFLDTRSSRDGDSSERLGLYMSIALATLILSSSEDSSIRQLVSQQIPRLQQHQQQITEEEIESAYLALNQVTPFIRFAHLSANQAILEAVESEECVHIVDLGIMQGLQWPPLMQALSEKRLQQQNNDQNEMPPLRLRITGTGHSKAALERTGSRLREFARTLGLPFEFNAVYFNFSDNDDDVAILLTADRLRLRRGEALAVNCMMQLHSFLLPKNLVVVLRSIKALSPKIVTIAEKEADLSSEIGIGDRFMEALDHYTALFDSLEATLPAKSNERRMIEHVLLGTEIMDVIAYERKRHQKLEQWKKEMESTGFELISASEFASAQARLLLRLHYPADGYRLVVDNDEGGQGCLLLNWRNKPLFSVSSWR